MRLRELLRNRNFRLLFVGSASNMLGDAALVTTLAIWAKSLTGSDTTAALTLLFMALPSVLSPLGGALADRLPRRTFLVLGNLVAAAAVTPLLLVRGPGGLWLLYVVAAVTGLSCMVLNAGTNGLLKQMLPAELLVDANSALRSVRESFRLAGPLVGAALFVSLDAVAVMWFDIATFLAAAAAVALVRCHDPVPVHVGPSRFDVGEGLRALRRDSLLLRIAVVFTAASLIAGACDVANIAIVEGLGQPSAFLGVMLGIQGLGAVGAGFLAPRLIRACGEGCATAVGLIAFGAGYLLLATALLPLAYVGMVVSGAGMPLAHIAFTTALQSRTPDRLVGRVTAATDVMLGPAYVLSAGAGAIAVATVDFRVLCVVLGILLIVVPAVLRTPTPAPPPPLPSTALVPLRALVPALVPAQRRGEPAHEARRAGVLVAADARHGDRTAA